MSDAYLPGQFVEHSLSEPPEVLYHYTDQDALLGIIKNGELWATKVQYMNDATEFGVSLNFAREELERMLREKHEEDSRESLKTACDKFLRSLSGLETINIFVACFCKNGDLLSQWRGYAGRGGGYSIGFQSRALAQTARASANGGFILGKCIYDAGVQRAIVNDAVEYCLRGELAGRVQWGRHGPLADILFRCGAFFKDASFSEEREWRLVSQIIDLRSVSEDRFKFRAGRSLLMPYYALPIEVNGGLPIRHVFVGPCPHMELAKSAVESLLSQKGIRAPSWPSWGPPVVFSSKIPFRHW